MPKPILSGPKTQAQTRTDNILSASVKRETAQVNTVQNQMVLDRLLRKPRSKAYMEAMAKLDAGGHVHNHGKIQEIIDAIREEFPEVDIYGVLIGIVSECYLGDSYEVHTLDFGGGIVEHYKRGQKLPGLLESARGIALRGGYSFIEVYADCYRCVGYDGSVSVVRP